MYVCWMLTNFCEKQLSRENGEILRTSQFFFGKKVKQKLAQNITLSKFSVLTISEIILNYFLKIFETRWRNTFNFLSGKVAITYFMKTSETFSKIKTKNTQAADNLRRWVFWLRWTCKTIVKYLDIFREFL